VPVNLEGLVEAASTETEGDVAAQVKLKADHLLTKKQRNKGKKESMKDDRASRRSQRNQDLEKKKELALASEKDAQLRKDERETQRQRREQAKEEQRRREEEAKLEEELLLSVVNM